MMRKKNLADILWGEKSRFFGLLFPAAIIILFGFLGSKILWTQEWRWANIAHQMIIRRDYLHPYLGAYPYFDKPLGSYWLIVLFHYLLGQLNLWAIRLPSAMAGLITVLCTYRIGKIVANRQTAMIASWLLITCGYFVFWSRVSTSDMLSVAGIMLSIAWYFSRRENLNFFSYFIFFLLLAIASQFKGLVAPSVVFLAIFPDLLFQNRWKQHVNWHSIIAIIPGVILYFTPFILANHFQAQNYSEDGLNQVFAENFVRYFHPFDHVQPFYVYFIDLPAMIFPWIFFTIPALFTLPARWKKLSSGSRWFFWSTLLTFLFFMCSGSRRSYYILPVIPLILLFTADWIHSLAEKNSRLNRFAAQCVFVFYAVIIALFLIIIPLADSGGGAPIFAKHVKEKAIQIKPWDDWQVYLINTDHNMTYYLRSSHVVNTKKVDDQTDASPTKENILRNFPILKAHDQNTIIIIGEDLFQSIKTDVKDYTVVITQPTMSERLLNNIASDRPVALIPNQQ